MLEIWKNHEDQNQRPSSAALNSLSLVLQTWVFQRASDPSDPYTSIHGLSQFFTILTSAHHTIKNFIIWLIWWHVSYKYSKWHLERKHFFTSLSVTCHILQWLVPLITVLSLLSSLWMEGTGKKIEKKLTTRDLWSANFNLTNTLGFAKQYIYQILHNITERYLIINRNLYFYKQTTNASLTTLSVTYDWL